MTEEIPDAHSTCMHTHTHTYEGSREHMSMTERQELLVKCLLWPQIRYQHQACSFLPFFLHHHLEKQMQSIESREHQTQGSYNLSIFGDELGWCGMEKIQLETQETYVVP